MKILFTRKAEKQYKKLPQVLKDKTKNNSIFFSIILNIHPCALKRCLELLALRQELIKVIVLPSVRMMKGWGRSSGLKHLYKVTFLPASISFHPLTFNSLINAKCLTLPVTKISLFSIAVAAIRVSKKSSPWER